MRFSPLVRACALFAALALGGAVACAPTQPGFGPQTGGSFLGTNGGGFSDMGQRETFGALLGGVAGAVAGAQYGRHGSSGHSAMMAVGGLVGALLGQQVGQGLDRASQANQAMTFHRMMATGMPQQWHGQITHGGFIKSGFHPLSR